MTPPIMCCCPPGSGSVWGAVMQCPLGLSVTPPSGSLLPTLGGEGMGGRERSFAVRQEN